MNTPKTCFFLLLVFIVFCHDTASPQAAHDVISPGSQFPSIMINDRLSPDDLSYLGLAKKTQARVPGEPLTIKDISADLIVVEFLNAYCNTCQLQVGLVNQCYKDIVNTPDLNRKVKILGIAAGNYPAEVARFKEKKSLQFPVLPDPDFDAYDLIGNPSGTPLTILVRKSGDKLIVAAVYKGLLASSAYLLRKIRYSLNGGIRVASANNMNAEAPSYPPEQRSIMLDLTRAEVKRLVEHSMRASSRASERKEVIALEKIALPRSGDLYRGTITNGTGRTVLFSKVISRNPVCDICHGVHFIVTFDNAGVVTDFSPIHLTKKDNEEWCDGDVHFMREKLVGKSLNEKLAFNAEADAISTATMTSALIFNSINRLADVYAEISSEHKRLLEKYDGVL